MAQSSIESRAPMRDRVERPTATGVLGATAVAAVTLAVAFVRDDALAFTVFALTAVIATIVARAMRRVRAIDAERAVQQEHLERQALELEEQAVELEEQVEELGRVNAALQVSEASTVRANAELVKEMAERARQRAFVDAALRTVPIALSLIDRDMRYIRVNAATAALTGLPVDAHPGRTLREVNPRLSPDLEAAIVGVLATGEPCLDFDLPRVTPHAKGGTVHLVVHITALRDATNAIVGVCSAATDVTSWRSLQARLAQAQRLEAVGQLAAGVAHDFNNLLTVIASCCDLMLMEMPGGSVHRADVEEIRQAANSATLLARRMLGVAHHRALVAKPLQVSTLIHDARDILARITRDRVRLDVQRATGPGVIVADPTQVEQVLLNLVINAVDAMPDGGTITLATKVLSIAGPRTTLSGPIPAGDYVELTVSDSGVGMDEATLAQIFEPFFTTKPPDKGTGLGLATVVAILRDLGGSIEVTSAPGKGTTFAILLPHVATEDGAGPRQARRAAADALPRGSETLLLVEDEDLLRASVARVFTRHGYRVLQARHGGEALRMLSDTEEIALVVSDLHMPGVGGHELMGRMRAAGRQVPVLFMSGSSGVGDAAGEPPTASDASQRFISKPFELEELLRTVREMLTPV